MRKTALCANRAGDDQMSSSTVATGGEAAGEKPPGQSENKSTPSSLSEMLKSIVAHTDGEKVSIADILDTFGNKSFGPALLIPAIIAVAPTGAIPGMSIVTGTIIFLVSAQMLIGREHIWLPKRATQFEIERQKLKSSVEKLLPWTDWLEDVFSQRLSIFVTQPAVSILALTCMLLAVSMFPLALLPFAVAIPGMAICLFALGLTLRDGLLVAIGYALSIAAGYLVWTLI
jgi:hypothetical protein